MKQGITIKRGYDIHDTPIVTITKRRGKLTLQEVCDLLRFGEGNNWCGHYAILLNCSEATIDGDGYFDEDEPAGDALSLYPIEDGETCPICGNYTPPFTYCPSCGASWKDMEDNIEKRIAGMRAETERELSKPSLTPEARAAWYWSFIGSVDMARQLDLITDERRQEIYREVEGLKP